MEKQAEKNVLGSALEPCCFGPVTGFYRDGFCSFDVADRGKHIVCAQVTQEFLLFSKRKGNDLMTPRPEFGFAGLKAGNLWCLCITRWMEALEGECAPRLKLRSCHEKTLAYVPLELLQKYAVADS